MQQIQNEAKLELEKEVIWADTLQAPEMGTPSLVYGRNQIRRRALVQFKNILSSPSATAGAGLVAFWIIAAIFAPLLSGYPPNAQDVSALGDPTPGLKHWLGTDQLGRDILARLVWGARTVLILAPVAVATAYAVGSAMGLLAGYFGGWVDQLVSRLSDLILSFPVLILYIVLIGTLGPSAFNIVLAVTLASAPAIGRIVRGLALELRTHEYVRAAQLRGESSLYIMIVELLPNARGPLIVDACLRMGYVIIKIGSLGFLGLGLPPPDPEWGGMVKDAAALIFVWPHIAIFPCLAISSLVIGFNLLADGLREASLNE